MKFKKTISALITVISLINAISINSSAFVNTSSVQVFEDFESSQKFISYMSGISVSTATGALALSDNYSLQINTATIGNSWAYCGLSMRPNITFSTTNGIVFRLKTNALAGSLFRLRSGTYKAGTSATYRNIDGSSISSLGDGSFDGGLVSKIPANNFDGYVFIPINKSSLDSDFNLDVIGSLWNNGITYVDNFAYYSGTDYQGIVNSLNTSLFSDKFNQLSNLKLNWSITDGKVNTTWPGISAESTYGALKYITYNGSNVLAMSFTNASSNRSEWSLQNIENVNLNLKFGDIPDQKGIYYYIDNKTDVPINFFSKTINNNAWSTSKLGSNIMLISDTDKTKYIPKTIKATGIEIPANFKGYIAMPFSSFCVNSTPSSNSLNMSASILPANSIGMVFSGNVASGKYVYLLGYGTYGGDQSYNKSDTINELSNLNTNWTLTGDKVNTTWPGINSESTYGSLKYLLYNGNNTLALSFTNTNANRSEWSLQNISGVKPTLKFGDIVGQKGIYYYIDNQTGVEINFYSKTLDTIWSTSKSSTYITLVSYDDLTSYTSVLMSSTGANIPAGFKGYIMMPFQSFGTGDGLNPYSITTNIDAQNLKANSIGMVMTGNVPIDKYVYLLGYGTYGDTMPEIKWQTYANTTTQLDFETTNDCTPYVTPISHPHFNTSRITSALGGYAMQFSVTDTSNQSREAFIRYPNINYLTSGNAMRIYIKNPTSVSTMSISILAQLLDSTSVVSSTMHLCDLNGNLIIDATGLSKIDIPSNYEGYLEWSLNPTKFLNYSTGAFISFINLNNVQNTFLDVKWTSDGGTLIFDKLQSYNALSTDMINKTLYSDLRNGMFFNWTGAYNNGSSGTGIVSSSGAAYNGINDYANSFDLDKIVDSIATLGLDYVNVTNFHGLGTTMNPSSALDFWRGNGYATSQRNFTKELIKKLKGKGISCMMFTHPLDGHDYPVEQQELLGYNDSTDNYKKWNDFINSVYADIASTYGRDLVAIGFDSEFGQSSDPRWQGKLDLKRLRNTIKTYAPDITLFGLSEPNDLTDFRLREVWRPSWLDPWMSRLESDFNVEDWPAYERPVAAVIGHHWGTVNSVQNSIMNLTAEQLYRYSVLQIATATDGPGTAWSTSPYSDGTWEKSVYGEFLKEKLYMDTYRSSFTNTLPSTSYVTMEGMKLNSLPNGIAAMRAKDNSSEYIHVLNPPSGNVLTLPSPADGKQFTSAVLLPNNENVTITQNSSTVTLTLPVENTWNSLDTVFKLTVNQSSIPVENYALHKPIFYSSSSEATLSTNSAFSHMFLTDGIREYRQPLESWAIKQAGYSSKDSILSSPQWVTVDLLSTKNINNVTLWPRSEDYGDGFPKDFYIDVSNDNINWETVVTESNFSKPSSKVTLYFTEQNSRYVRITATSAQGNDPNSCFILNEMEVSNQLISNEASEIQMLYDFETTQPFTVNLSGLAASTATGVLALSGDKSLKLDTTSFGDTWGSCNTLLPDISISNPTGIVFRMKTNAVSQGLFRFRSGSYTAAASAVFKNTDGTSIYSMGDGDWGGPVAKLPMSNFDGYVFIPIDYISLGADFNLDFIQALWNNSTTFIDDIAFYSGTDYSSIIRIFNKINTNDRADQISNLTQLSVNQTSGYVQVNWPGSDSSTVSAIGGLKYASYGSSQALMVYLSTGDTSQLFVDVPGASTNAYNTLGNKLGLYYKIDNQSGKAFRFYYKNHDNTNWIVSKLNSNLYLSSDSNRSLLTPIKVESSGALIPAGFKGYIIMPWNTFCYGDSLQVSNVDFDGSTIKQSRIGFFITGDSSLSGNSNIFLLGYGTYNVAVTGVLLNKHTTVINVNSTESLVATVSPSDATNKAILWESSNTNIASVNNGVVTGKAAGAATITAKSSDDETIISTCVVTVENVPFVEPVDLSSFNITNNIMTNVNSEKTEAEIRGILSPQNGVTVTFTNIVNGIVGTGTIITVKNSVNNTIYAVYTVVIFGDVSGDGIIDCNDLIDVRNYLLEDYSLSSLQLIAGDLYGEENVTLNDLVGIMAYISESGNINQNIKL